MRPQQVNEGEWMVWNRAIGRARKAFFSGRKSFEAGRLSNPFKSDTFDYREWLRGFNTAYNECLNRNKKREAQSLPS